MMRKMKKTMAEQTTKWWKLKEIKCCLAFMGVMK